MLTSSTTNVATSGYRPRGRFLEFSELELPTFSRGEVRNYGWEVALGWRKQIGDFSYGLHGQISYAKNKIIRKEEGYKTPLVHVCQRKHHRPFLRTDG